MNILKNTIKTNYKANPKTRIGHVHLTVSNLDRSLKFYKDILGFEVTSKLPGAVFLSAGGYHHHIGLNTWAGENAQRPQQGTTGLYHFAILYPTRKELAKVLKSLVDNKYSIDGFADHGVSEAIYLLDPDGNGVELYWDKPKKLWPQNSEGKLVMYTKPLDVDGLLNELKKRK